MPSSTNPLKNSFLFIIIVVIDITIIQIFRYFTPVIVPLRFGFYFLVIASSIYIFYTIINPKNPLKTGLLLSLVCFAIALSESYILHVLIEKGSYKTMYLIPSSFALILPTIMAWIYKITRRKY